MKCDACGAPVENGVCTYCGKEFPEESVKVVEKEEAPKQPQKVIVNVVHQADPVVVQEVKKKNSFWKTCGIILLWICFLPIMLSIYVWKSDKFSKKTKYILLAVIWLATIILGAAGNKMDTSTSTTDLENVPIYNNASIEDLKNGTGTETIGQVSIIHANKADITDDVLNDWFSNHVSKNDYNYCVIVYDDVTPTQGVYATKNQVQKDIELIPDNNVYSVGSDSGSTFYSVGNDGKLTPYYTEPTEEEANQIISQIDGFISSDFKGEGYSVEVGGDKNKLDANITLVKSSMDENTYKNATAYLAKKVKESGLPIGYLNVAYQTDQFTVVALGSVDDATAYTGPENVNVKLM